MECKQALTELVILLPQNHEQGITDMTPCWTKEQNFLHQTCSIQPVFPYKFGHTNNFSMEPTGIQVTKSNHILGTRPAFQGEITIEMKM